MDKHEFQCKSWRFVYSLIAPYIVRKFNLTHDDLDVSDPCFVVCNHASSWDPLMLGCCFPNNKVYYVASEHIFRLGPVSWIIEKLVAPIPRRKATLGTDTVMQCLRHMRDGHTVCIFPEGDATWNGITQKVFSNTGKLVRNSGATLVTYRLEGNYLSAPRWGKGTRRGKINARLVGVYPPEELKKMKPDEITALINKDIFEDAWERQKTEKLAFKGKAPARFMERAVYLCPECKKIGHMKGEGDTIRCSCGFERRFTPYGSFEPAQPFENIAQWDAWQKQMLAEGNYEHGSVLFSDDCVTLRELTKDHGEKNLVSGSVCIENGAIKLADYTFDMTDISFMSLVQASILLFTYKDKYYEIHADKPRCLRKYFEVWLNETKLKA